MIINKHPLLKSLMVSSNRWIKLSKKLSPFETLWACRIYPAYGGTAACLMPCIFGKLNNRSI